MQIIGINEDGQWSLGRDKGPISELYKSMTPLLIKLSPWSARVICLRNCISNIFSLSFGTITGMFIVNLQNWCKKLLLSSSQADGSIFYNTNIISKYCDLYGRQRSKLNFGRCPQCIVNDHIFVVFPAWFYFPVTSALVCRLHPLAEYHHNHWRYCVWIASSWSPSEECVFTTVIFNFLSLKHIECNNEDNKIC